MIGRYVLAGLLLAGTMAPIASGRSVAASTEPPGVSEVWALEEAYWRYVKAGDVENYVTLWHADFIGWPCDQPHPMRKDSVGAWVKKVRDEDLAVTYALTREGAQDFDGIVVVHYQFTMESTYPDGRVEGVGVRKKITHTWLRVGSTWQIIGGMCGPLEQPGS
jgi:Domain of unknown function (DUF4440)